MNRETRPAGEFSKPATLKGWRRVWENRTADPNRVQQCTSLSAEALKQPSGGSIDGVIGRMPRSHLAQLDEREAGYDRLALSVDQFDISDNHVGVEADVIYVYQSERQNRFLANDEHPILQSYIDCVLAGYLTQFGPSGMQAMVDSTRGWNRPIMDDRAAPHYPRAVQLGQDLQLEFDRIVAAAKACSTE